MGISSSAFVQGLFDRGGLRTVFDHARNAVVATIIIAAGSEATKISASDIRGFFDPAIAGYAVAGVGCILIALNFIDGLRRLARLRWHFLLQFSLAVAYLVISLRLVQLIVFFRTHSC